MYGRAAVNATTKCLILVEATTTFPGEIVVRCVIFTATGFFRWIFEEGSRREDRGTRLGKGETGVDAARPNRTVLEWARSWPGLVAAHRWTEEGSWIGV